MWRVICHDAAFLKLQHYVFSTNLVSFLWNVSFVFGVCASLDYIPSLPSLFLLSSRHSTFLQTSADIIIVRQNFQHLQQFVGVVSFRSRFLECSLSNTRQGIEGHQHSGFSPHAGSSITISSMSIFHYGTLEGGREEID